MVDSKTLEFVYSLLQTVSLQMDWKSALDTLLASLREEFVYDNVAVYLPDSRSQTIDVGYARAVGRGKDAEADISWGEGIGNECLRLSPPPTLVGWIGNGPPHHVSSGHSSRRSDRTRHRRSSSTDCFERTRNGAPAR